MGRIFPEPPHYILHPITIHFVSRWPCLIKAVTLWFFVLAHLDFSSFFAFSGCLLSSEVITSWPKLPQMNMNVPVVLTLEVVVAVVVVEFPWLVSPSAVQHLLRYIFVLRSSNLAPPSNRNGLLLLLLSFLLFFFWVRHWMRRMEDADSEKPFATDSHRYNVTLMMWKTHRPTDRPNVGLPILVSAWRSSFLNFTFSFFICKFKACEIETPPSSW